MCTSRSKHTTTFCRLKNHLHKKNPSHFNYLLLERDGNKKTVGTASSDRKLWGKVKLAFPRYQRRAENTFSIITSLPSCAPTRCGTHNSRHMANAWESRADCLNREERRKKRAPFAALFISRARISSFNLERLCWDVTKNFAIGSKFLVKNTQMQTA